jgi:hypothetical protein
VPSDHVTALRPGSFPSPMSAGREEPP